MTTLDDFTGNSDHIADANKMVEPPEETRQLVKIFEPDKWADAIALVEQNRKTHPTEDIDIIRDAAGQIGVFTVNPGVSNG
jgi:hypothetical protein